MRYKKGVGCKGSSRWLCGLVRGRRQGNERGGRFCHGLESHDDGAMGIAGARRKGGAAAHFLPHFTVFCLKQVGPISLRTSTRGACSVSGVLA